MKSFLRGVMICFIACASFAVLIELAFESIDLTLNGYLIVACSGVSAVALMIVKHAWQFPRYLEVGIGLLGILALKLLSLGWNMSGADQGASIVAIVTAALALDVIAPSNDDQELGARQVFR